MFLNFPLDPFEFKRRTCDKQIIHVRHDVDVLGPMIKDSWVEPAGFEASRPKRAAELFIPQLWCIARAIGLSLKHTTYSLVLASGLHWVARCTADVHTPHEEMYMKTSSAANPRRCWRQVAAMDTRRRAAKSGGVPAGRSVRGSPAANSWATNRHLTSSPFCTST